MVNPRREVVVGPDDFDDVEASSAAFDIIPLGEGGCSPADSKPLVAVDRVGWTIVGVAAASLDLHIDHGSTVDGDDIELSQAVTYALADNLKPSATKILCRDSLPPSTQCLALARRAIRRTEQGAWRSQDGV